MIVPIHITVFCFFLLLFSVADLIDVTLLLNVLFVCFFQSDFLKDHFFFLVHFCFLLNIPETSPLATNQCKYNLIQELSIVVHFPNLSSI